MSMEKEQDPVRIGGEAVCSGYAEAKTASELNIIFAGNIAGNLAAIETALGDVTLISRDSWIRITGKTPEAYRRVKSLLDHLFKIYGDCGIVRQTDIDSAIKTSLSGGTDTLKAFHSARIKVSKRKQEISPRTANQLAYVDAMNRSDIVFALGPAGTGKTYLAVAMAVSRLLAGKCERIVLARPAVEAGENLGFLPGDLEEKINPYLRPLNDALHEMLDPAELEAFRERGMIELAPLAFMRGRTLNNSFIILDEAQNATEDQMLMFLTRLGFHSSCVISGDPTQTDLPRKMKSGLLHACRLLEHIEGIRVCRFGKGDVLRHSLVERIVRAYEEDKRNRSTEQEGEEI